MKKKFSLIAYFIFTLALISPAHASVRYYAVQIGAFQSESNATILVKKLNSQGYPAYFKTAPAADPSKKSWNMVFVGRYDSEIRARREAVILKQKKIITGKPVIKSLTDGQESTTNAKDIHHAQTDYSKPKEATLAAGATPAPAVGRPTAATPAEPIKIIAVADVRERDATANAFDKDQLIKPDHLASQKQPAAQTPAKTNLVAENKDQTTNTGEKTEKAANPFFSITPRAWYTIINMNDYESSQNRQSSTKNATMFIYGGTLTLSPSVWPQTDFLLTILYGTGDTTGQEVSKNGAAEFRNDITRTDVELLGRYRIKDSATNIFYGLRYISLNTEEKYLTPGATWNESGTDTRKRDRYYWIPEIGAGFATDITGSGRHRLFANATLGYAFGKRKKVDTKPSYTGDVDSTDNGVTFDTNVGYEYIVLEQLSLHTRYRAFFKRNQNSEDSNDYTIVHGPEIGMKLSF